jgi:hypothetical protein
MAIYYTIAPKKAAPAKAKRFPTFEKLANYLRWIMYQRLA